jgi:polyisoprenoid-binding protein YceI
MNAKSMIAREIRRRAVLCGLLLAGVVLLPAAESHRQPPAAVAQPSGAGEIVFSLDPAQSKVHYTVGSTLHTVHGTFAFKRGALRIEPASGRAAGEIVVDATSGESGNDGRDKKMHKDVLQSNRYTEVIFRPDRVDGKIPATGTVSAQLHGILTVHGSDHEVTVPAQAELSGDRWKGTVKFRIPYVEWGMKSASTFLLKADSFVDIELEMSGSVQPPQSAAGSR